jgi:hypothetical protein
MILVNVEVEENINIAVDETLKVNIFATYNLHYNTRPERGDYVLELDQFKYTLGTYEKPLVEVGDSL